MTGVVVKDNGAALMLSRARELAKGRVVRVGILADAPKDVRPDEKPSSMTLAEIAALHEFGAPGAHIPQRSFIRATVDLHREEIQDLQVKLAARVLAGKLTPDQALGQLGAKVVGFIQRRIASNIPPKLKDATIAAKGSSVSLVDTGQLRSSVTWELA